VDGGQLKGFKEEIHHQMCKKGSQETMGESNASVKKGHNLKSEASSSCS